MLGRRPDRPAGRRSAAMAAARSPGPRPRRPRRERTPQRLAADIDLDEHVEADAVLGRGIGDLRDVVRIVGADADLGLACEERQPFQLAAPTTWLETSTSGTPPRTMTSASETFWQQTPTAPCAIWRKAMTGLLWVLAWARKRTPAVCVASAMRFKLRSKASRSTSSAGVSTWSSAMPGAAGGGSMGNLEAWRLFEWRRVGACHGSPARSSSRFASCRWPRTQLTAGQWRGEKPRRRGEPPPHPDPIIRARPTGCDRVRRAARCAPAGEPPKSRTPIRSAQARRCWGTTWPKPARSLPPAGWP